MRQSPQGVRSTKMRELVAATLPMEKECDIFARVEELRNTIYTDQTGKFPITSSRGNKYIMTMVEIDANAILVEPMKNRTGGKMIRAYMALLGRLKRRGIKPKKHILDNEASDEFKSIIEENGMTYELVPPDMHRRNIAEKAIQTFKDHFVAILSGVADSFPMHLWGRLLPQAETTVNLLRQAKVAPGVSAHAYLYGPHDYNKHPLAPLGCAVQIQEKPSRRKTWDPHSVDGWYVGMSTEHYRCFRVYHKETRAERVSDTVFFKHQYITVPKVTRADALIKAAKELTSVIRNGLPSATPATNMEDLTKLASIFEDVVSTTKESELSGVWVPPPRVAEPPPRVEDGAALRVEEDPPPDPGELLDCGLTEVGKHSGPAMSTRA
ncbi:hypothetical protein ACHAW6_006805 [Cyclotella cf. meneghiniana]